MKTVTQRPFLAKVLDYFNNNSIDTFNDCIFIFPGQLSIDYFQQLLAKEKWLDGSMPTCLTLYQVMLADSKMKEASILVLVKELYGLANGMLHSSVSFEKFYSFGISLLQDFNLLDQYLINGSDLFVALMQQKQLTVPLNIQNFFGYNQLQAFQHVTDLTLFQQKEASLFWEKLPLLYQNFTQKLIEKGEGYKGLICRIALDRCLLEKFSTNQQFFFVGFNLLTPAEEQYIIQCKTLAPVVLFWDVDAHYLDSEINIAGYYLRKHRQKKWCQESFPTRSPTYLSDPNKKVVVTEMNDGIAEVQSVIACLQEQTDEGKQRFLPRQTAIVVSGSELLIPLLDGLAHLPIPLHFSLHYPLSATVIYTLIEKLTAIWAQSMDKNHTIQTLYDHLTGILVLFEACIGVDMQRTIATILKWLSKPSSDFELFKQQLGPFSLLLNGYHKGLYTYLQEIFIFMYQHFNSKNTLFLDLNRTALRYILQYIAPLVEIVDGYSIPFFLNNLKISTIELYQYNPLRGLYIIEASQADNLDFENLFFINMSEGSFPKKHHSDSFLSHHLRKNFGLPLADKAIESVTAYGFYRLLQRGKHIYCSYSKQNNCGVSSEVSRLLLQLKYDSKLQIIEQHLPMHLSKLLPSTISVDKDGIVMQLLEKFLVQENVKTSSLTSSALITYLSCPLQFYFSYLLQLKRTTLSNNIEEAVQLGIMFHNTIASLYKPFVGMNIDRSIITQLKLKIKNATKIALIAQLKAVDSYESILLAALTEKLLERVLTLDNTTTPFTILGVEVNKAQSIEIVLALDEKKKVSLSGIIDRIDIQGDVIRIIEYKTGISNCKISSIEALFDCREIKKNKAIFQLIFYAWLFKSTHVMDSKRGIMPYLIDVRSLFLDSYRAGIFIQDTVAIKKYKQVEDIKEYSERFEKGLYNVLLEIFDPTIPFIQTEDLEVCKYCPYVSICQRD